MNNEVKPFTAEEAREEARLHESEALSMEGSPSREEGWCKRAVVHARRKALSLRHYASLLSEVEQLRKERDEARRVIAAVAEALGGCATNIVISQASDTFVKLARARAVTGPACPQCGKFLKAEHRLAGRIGAPDAYVRGYGALTTPCITASDLLTNYPEIAKEMGITK